MMGNWVGKEDLITFTTDGEICTRNEEDAHAGAGETRRLFTEDKTEGCRNNIGGSAQPQEKDSSELPYHGSAVRA